MTPFVAAHACGASLALLLGAWQLLRRQRGDRIHRLVGRVWVVDMYWVVLSSFGIRELDPGHLSWIHALSALTFVTLTVATWAAVTHRVELHRRFVRGSYLGLVGAFVGAVAAPRRELPQLLVHRPFVLALSSMAVVVLAMAVVALCVRWADDRRRDQGTCATPGSGTPGSRSRSSRSAA